MFRKKKFDPDLINLHDYEAKLLLWRDEGIILMPVPSIPGRMDRNWTCEEEKAMRKNRRLAKAIYERVKAGL